MRIAITGATGNVGTSVIETLADEPRIDSIVGLARRRPDWDPPKVEWVEADIATDELTPHLEGADAVIHLAWAIQPSRDPRRLRETNLHGSRRVFEATALAGARSLIHASSVGAYSPAGRDLPPVDESWPTGGVQSSFYSRHKAAVEGMLDRFEEEHPGVRTVRLRPALIFKDEAAVEIRRLFAGPLIPASLVRPDRLPVLPWISGLTIQAVHSLDVAEAYRLAVVSDARGAYNLAAEPVLDGARLGESLSARTIAVPAGLVRLAASTAWRLRLDPTPPGWLDMALAVPMMATTRARRELGWQPARRAEEAITEVLEGMARGEDHSTPPLDADTSGRLRIRELITGIGRRDG